MRTLSLALLLLSLAAGTLAGSTSGLTEATTFAGSAQTRLMLRIAVIQDLQNYCSSVPGPTTPNAEELAEGRRMLGILVRDVISMKPDIVLQVGDLADQDSSNGDDATDLDNYTLGLSNPAAAAIYNELVCIKENFFDHLDDAGIPWIEAFGNHDSYRDVERAYPRDDFMALSYAYAAQEEVDRYHAGYSDTEERAALFTTPIGPLCVVTADFVNSSDLDQSFVNTNIGCGAGRPTIVLSHDLIDVTGNNPPFAAAGNSEVFAHVYGHLTPTQPGTWQSATKATVAGGFEVVALFTNSQEGSRSCGATSTVRDGSDVHTGNTWWATLTIDPTANSITVQARNPYYGGIAFDPKCGNTYQNKQFALSPSFCTRFAGGPGC